MTLIKPQISLLLTVFLLYATIAYTQIGCKTSEANKVYHSSHPIAQKEYQNTTLKGKVATLKSPPGGQFIIPVVFHVYGTDFNGKQVNQEIIENALADANKDFQGLNDDFNSVDSNFTNLRGSMDIIFALAKNDPDGNPTTGVVYHSNKSGYGLANTNDAAIALDAWDNYKYMNVYIQNDLYDDGDTQNSGVAWYPSTYMSDRDIARIVYNGRYLGSNTGKEFASVLTHEFGHWLNLIHTFEGGCSGTDHVDDTPPEDGNHNLGCTPGTNCDGMVVNVENYMGYNGASGCYKMFTIGQINRMISALSHPSRATLWTEENLSATGLSDLIDPNANSLPAIAILSPTNNAEIEQGEPLSVTLEVSDPNGLNDIKQVTVNILDQTITITEAPYETQIDNLPLGTHTLEAIVEDQAGETRSASVTVQVVEKDAPPVLPQITWNLLTYSYLVDGEELSDQHKVLEVTILDEEKPHEIELLGPNDYFRKITTEVGDEIIIGDLEPGTWIVRIPSENKKLTKSFQP
ncbi:MAG: M43 family zinc metalloprotease [Allomuricauda sp.]